MRTIKFRAWDKTSKKYTRFDGVHDTMMISRDGSVEYYNLQNGSGGNEYILEQFIGIKDEHGMGIFEGDILKCGNGDIGEVVFNDCSFNVREYYNQSSDYPTMAFSENESFEVIGNIHENPEFLEATT